MTLPIDKKLLKLYPSSDGKPMAENTIQFDWIVLIKQGLEEATAGQEIFVAGDLLWYPIEGNPKVRLASDVMVALGRPKGHRSSYLQWLEEDIAPQVVIEILSPGNRVKEMQQKLDFYQRHGVEEYYIYNPEPKNVLETYIREAGKLVKQEGVKDWTSPLLKIRWHWTAEKLELYHADGSPFINHLERKKEVEAAQKETEIAKKETEAAEAKIAALAAKLRELGIDPDSV